MGPRDPRIIEHLRPAGTTLAAVVGANVAGALALVGQVFALAHLVVVVVDGPSTRLPAAALLVAVAFAVRALLGWLADRASAALAVRVTTRLRARLLDAVLALPGQELAERRSGELALLLTRGVAATEPYLTRYVPALVLAVVLPPFTLVALATQDLVATGIVLATLPLVPLFAALVGLATRDRAERQWQALAQLSGHFVDVVRGLPTLVVHGRARAQSRTIRRVTDEHRRATLATLQLAFASSAVLELVATLSVALVAVVVGVRLASGGLGLFTALVVLLLVPEAYWPLRRVGAEFHAAAEGTATFERASRLLATGGAAVPAAAGAGHRLGRVVVDGLRVRYPGRRTPALAVDRLALPARGMVAVTGPSGCGKSTLLAALAGEVVPEAGTIAAETRSLDATTVGSWRRDVAWVPQRPWLTAGSVRDNVLLGRPGATDGDVRRALTLAGLGGLADADGLDRRLDEDGTGLSAGQRARLALARAFVSGRGLVLVDEPSAHLDDRSEQELVAALRRLARSATVVVVTHSPRISAAADEVVALAATAGTDPAPPASARGRGTRVVQVPSTDGPDPRQRQGGRRLSGAYALGVLAAASGVALTVTSGWLITRAAERPPLLFLMVAIVGVRTFGIGRPLLRYAERLVGHDAALRLLAEERTRVYDRVVPLTPGALGRRRGDVLASMVDDVDAVVDARLRVRSPLVTAAAVGVGGLAAGWLVRPAAGLAVGALLVVAAVVAGAVRLRVGRLEAASVAARADLSTRVLETVQAARDLVLWQATGPAVERVRRAAGELAGTGRRSATTVGAGRGVLVLSTGLAVALVAAALEPAVRAGGVAGPWAAGAVLLPLALLEVLAPLPEVAATAARTAAARGRLDELVRRTPVVADPARTTTTPEPGAALSVRGLTAGWDRDVLRDLELRLPARTRLGVVGPSGSGKSTLAALLVRFLDPRSGSVHLGGADVRDLALDDVRRHVTLLDDDPYVFSSTVYENLRLARPEATRAQVDEAVRSVSLGAWLDDLPDGLDTLLGDGHAGVSGGERARLGLARTLLGRSPVLVLDEPTAHLDRTTARAVARDVLAAAADRSLVWVTHDGVGLEAMDEVLDLAPAGH